MSIFFSFASTEASHNIPWQVGALPDHPLLKHFLNLKPTSVKPSLHKYFANDPGVVPVTNTLPFVGLFSLPHTMPALK